MEEGRSSWIGLVYPSLASSIGDALPSLLIRKSAAESNLYLGGAFLGKPRPTRLILAGIAFKGAAWICFQLLVLYRDWLEGRYIVG